MLYNLKSYVESRADRTIEIIAKVRAVGGGVGSWRGGAGPGAERGRRKLFDELCSGVVGLELRCSAQRGGCLAETHARRRLPGLPRSPGPDARPAPAPPQIESFDSIPNLASIIEASDGVMVARGDLGAQIPLEDVPSVQKEVVLRSRQMGKPVIVASHLLQSMLDVPTPTRAEVGGGAGALGGWLGGGKNICAL